MNLILMGLRGSGKSTLGRALSERTGLQFLDLDTRSAARLGASSVSEAWTRCGEPAFRAAETEALRDAIAQDIPILALGGGTPTAPGAADLLRSLKRPAPPRLIYLRAPAEALSRRLAQSGAADRPSLTGAGTIEEVAAVLAARDPFYLTLADATVEVGSLDRSAALATLLGFLGPS